MIRRPPRSTLDRSSAASDVYKRQIWHFRCLEISRARFDQNWIATAAEIQDSSKNSQFNADLMYLGDDGKPVFMPKPDAPPKSLAYPYRPDAAMDHDMPPLPVPYR